MSANYSIPKVSELSSQYGVPLLDVALMALNLSGLASSSGNGRARMDIWLDQDPETQWHVIIPTGQEHSPFYLDGKDLLLSGKRFAQVALVEHDDARLGYARNGGSILTANTNQRSTCTGCVFCPNTLADASDPRMTSAETEIEAWVKGVLIERGWRDFSGVEQINLSTGCFGTENSALEHLLCLRRILTDAGFVGRLGILSSVLRTKSAMERLASIGPFALFLTLECVTRRDVLLKRSKASLTAAEAIEVLRRARASEIDTGAMIVVGLDDLSLVASWLEAAAPLLTDFPNLQIFQAHTPYMEVFRTSGADQLGFFLDARRSFERILLPTGLRPRRWQNYRPLWHYQFAQEALPL